MVLVSLPSGGPRENLFLTCRKVKPVPLAKKGKIGKDTVSVEVSVMCHIILLTYYTI